VLILMIRDMMIHTQLFNVTIKTIIVADKEMQAISLEGVLQTALK